MLLSIARTDLPYDAGPCTWKPFSAIHCGVYILVQKHQHPVQAFTPRLFRLANFVSMEWSVDE